MTNRHASLHHCRLDTFEGDKETVTVRYRDSMKQDRIAVEELEQFMKDYFQ